MVSTILGRKIGMTQVWDDNDNVVPVTVIQAGPLRRLAGKDEGTRRLRCRADRLWGHQAQARQQAHAGAL